jgi:hypothetical protein
LTAGGDNFDGPCTQLKMAYFACFSNITELLHTIQKLACPQVIHFMWTTLRQPVIFLDISAAFL